MKLIIGWLSLLGGFTALAIGAGEDKEAVVPKFGKPLQMMADGKKVGTEAPGYAAPCWHDVDGDGQKDLIVGQFKGGKLRVYKNQGDLILGPGEWLQAGGSPASVPGVW